jgi:putative peptide zinc metalloprotease protein
MEKPIFSASWYRVASLRPRLRSHARIHRHRYRGEIWHVLEELTMERFFRFRPGVYSVVGQMDGHRTVEELWQDACSRMGDDAPTQDEMIQLLSQLYRGDVLQCDAPPDAAELLERYEEQARRRWQSKLFSVFSWSFSLLDPERILRFLLPVVRPFFGWPGALVWLGVVVPALVLLGLHWTDLTEGVLDRVFVPGNVLLLWLLFPVIKIFHEFGHAFAVKAFGGEVHDMGIMLLVFTPVPYVDASSSWAFREKWKRSLVGAAGMVTEVFIAALALYFWVNAEPGVARTIAYNIVFIASVSTIFFNANPLLRFDGYYILADLLEIPNLRARSNAYLMYLVERYLFGSRDAELPDATPSERAWFVSFGVLSFLYRVFVVTAILLFVATKFFVLGILLAVFALTFWLVAPIAKGIHFLISSPRLRSVRGRAVLVTVLVVAVLGTGVALVPVPYRTMTEGVVWIPEESLVRAGAEGFVARVDAASGAHVEEGALLVELRNPLLETDERVLLARIAELRARYVQYLSVDPVQADSTQGEIREAEGTLGRVREEVEALRVVSPAAGTFVVPMPEDLPDRFVRKGDLIGYLLEGPEVTVRTIVSQDLIDMVRSRTERVDVRLAEALDEPVPATFLRVVPGATERLPSRVLGTVGGGRIPTDPSDFEGLTAMEKLFQIDLGLPVSSGGAYLGGRAYVRFDHGWVPLGVQWYVQLRQLFLSRFDV